MTILKLFKLFILSHCLALSGSEFHDFEAARIKTAHRNALVFQVVGLIKDFIYLIVVFLLVRKAATCLLRCVTPDHNNSSLNFNLCLIGNQCNSLRTGFMRCDFLLFVINRAAKFCTSCRDTVGIVEVHMVELQLSSLLEIKAWIKISVSDFYKQFLIFAIQWNPFKPDPHEIGILSLPNLFFGPKISVIHFLYF